MKMTIINLLKNVADMYLRYNDILLTNNDLVAQLLSQQTPRR